MNLAHHIEPFGHVTKPDQRSDAAGHGNVASEYGSGVLRDPGSHAVEMAGGVFGGHYGDVQLLVELDVVVDIFLYQRVLVPVEVQFLNRSAHPECVSVLVSPHGVEHELHIRANSLAHRLGDFDVHLRVSVGMDFVGLPSHLLESDGLFRVLFGGFMVGGAAVHRHRLLAGSKQTVDRLSGYLAVDVPQADVDGADYVRRDRAVHLPHFPPDGADVLRIPAHHDRLDELHHALHEVVCAHTRRSQKGVARYAFVGLDGDDP